MLYIVLALVLAAFGLLIGALTTANTLWAWISVVVSVVAATLLVMDWLKGRRAKAAGTDESMRPRSVVVGGSRQRREEPAPVDDLDDLDDFDDGFDKFDEPPKEFPPRDIQREPISNLAFEPPVKAELPGGPMDERTVVTEAVEKPDAGPESLDLAGEPGEEPTDASDLLVVAGLSAEVRVVDEHPRYHLATCVWLANRPTIPVAVSEARQLGFTPCARCGPDGVLAARHRAAR
ncbi:hypothetical protein [Actinophytocola oryzae]|uniref:Uncharacterized protein n=1 Tax=Actinophytocola oryzae TaxID=502181 RepID=A0A4R7VBD8_9PSEU|nr:hypothetical protein [Actinophytocola oryzae]TDV46295.1 hypothetical protein CLV71_111254 [Actinophytocola oryzae]